LNGGNGTELSHTTTPLNANPNNITINHHNTAMNQENESTTTFHQNINTITTTLGRNLTTETELELDINRTNYDTNLVTNKNGHTNTTPSIMEDIPIINNNINNIVDQTLNNTNDTTLLSIILDEETQDDITRCLINNIKGDTLDQKDKDQLRIIFQNINSLRPSTTDKWEATITQMIEYHADIVGLCETCCNWKDTLLKKLFQIKANRLLKNPNLVTTTTSLSYTEKYLPGGCCQITANTWTTRIQNPIYDDFRLGRWIGTTYNVSPTKKLHIITAYRVCEHTSNTTNSLSTAVQQETMLLARGIEQPNPRKQFVDDFIHQFQPVCDDIDNYFLLSLDANSTVGNDKDGVDRLIEECNLVDVYTTIHQDYTQFPTQQRGSKKIDYMLSSRNLIPYITKCGYVCFNEAFDSDHRALFCDISHNILSDNFTPNSSRKRIIGSNSTNREGHRYIKHLHRNLVKNQIFEEVLKLEAAAASITNDTDKETLTGILNNIDETITKLMLSAEDNSVSIKDLALWSPILAQSNLIIQFWIITIKGARQHSNVKKRLKSITDKMSEETRRSIQTTSGSATRALRKAIKNHNILVKEHRKHREDHLVQKVKDLNERKDTKGVLEVEDLMKRERKKHDFARIRQVLRQRKSNGITTIEVPSSTEVGKWDLLTFPKAIETSLLDRGVNHFGQAKNTPFASPQLVNILGYKGTNKTSTQLIRQQQKTQELQEQPEYVQHIINKLSDGNNLQQIDSDISYDEFVSGIRKWREATTTSPSGRHLGHYKILTKLELLNEDNVNLSDEILKLYYTIIKITINLGQTLDRWCNISTLMIEKTPGIKRIDKLHVIHIYEADYNLLLKIMWARKAVWYMHDKQVINSGQCGSRPGYRAIDLVLQKELMYTYAHLTRTNLGTIDNDAKSCYDRMICSLSMCISQYYGIPTKYCDVQANTLQFSKYKIRTALGDSSECYQHSESTPIHGTGQGSCSSPALWLMNSSFLMDI
jgi:hypothetical protein